MNVFEWAAIKVRKHVVQLVKNYHEVKDEKKAPALMLGVKKDGVYGICVPNSEGEYAIFGRTGKKLNNLDAFSEIFTQHLNGSQVLIFEVCSDICSLEELSGILNPNRKKALDSEQEAVVASIYLAVHDGLSFGEFSAGKSDVAYKDRLVRLAHTVGHIMGVTSRIVPIRSTLVFNEEEALYLAEQHIANGEEGIVLKDPDAGWIAGRKNEVVMKIVKGVDYDLEVVGIEEGKGKRAGTMAKLVVRWRPFADKSADDILLPVDGCFSDEFRKACYDFPDDIIGRIVHVHALDIGSKGSLRIAKVRAVRVDKDEADL